MRLAQIFGWDLDFYTDPRPGDTFRVVVEKKTLASGEVASYGRILAAEYINGRHPYRAVLFHDPNGVPAYYTPDGKSMKKAFLHSPLKFAAVITSHFSEHRFHPILKEYRPHLGIDYAAPTGTPVQTIGDGRVIFAGRKGGAGNLIEIQHNNGYTTYYMHLSRVLVHSGERVEQGQRIGLVGMTGLATGPHLDFRIQRGKEFLNFERLPSAAIRSGLQARLERIRGGPRPRNGADASAAVAANRSRRQEFRARVFAGSSRRFGSCNSISCLRCQYSGLKLQLPVKRGYPKLKIGGWRLSESAAQLELSAIIKRACSLRSGRLRDDDARK